MNDDSEGYGADERPSKSQRKRDMTALQALGAELVALSADQLDRVELPERLREAIVEARQIKSFEARRRQLQYIGKLMRDVDAEPIRMTLEQWRGSAREATAQQHAVERWRDRLPFEPGDPLITLQEGSTPLVKAPLLSVFGGKITTYRRLAEHALRDLAPWYPNMGLPWTATRAVDGGEIGRAHV